jgi:DNA-binding NtrC family response regulator
VKDPLRVLVVDDDAAVRASLRAYLEDEGFEVSSAGAAGEALVIVGAGRIDVAIVDIRLPEMDGQTLILRAHELAPSVRYVIYTGSVAYQLPEALERMGMTPEDVLHKPARSLELLVAAVRRVAAKEIDRV